MKFLVFFTFLCACSRSESASVACTITAECPSGYHCASDRICRGNIACSTDDDCCLSERCVSRTCAARVQCSANSPCGLPGQVCASGICISAICSQSSDCTGGSSCWFGRCSEAMPCAGLCSQDEACAPAVNRCVKLHSQQPTCQPGQMRVLDDAQRLTDACQNLPEQTSCAPLPPLPEGQYGLPAVTLPLGQTLAVVAYDQTYGDVVLARHEASPPFARRSLTVLTGLPEQGVVTGDPHGPRLGMAAPGPDRGKVLAAAVDANQRLVVVLRDETADTLRYVRLDQDGTHEHVVSTEPGMGTALALKLDAQNRPVVLAFVPTRGNEPSRLQLYRAQNSTPEKVLDWQVETLDSEPAVNVPETPLAKQPQGRGAWLDLAQGDDGLWRAAAYSPRLGDVRLYKQQTAGGWQKLEVPRTAIPQLTNDFGRFVSLLVLPDGTMLAACEDHQWGRLLLLRETQTGVTARVIDTGDRADGHHRVGADVRLVRHPAGGLIALHQDTRRADLLATRLAYPEATPTQQTVQTLEAAGFSPTLVQLGTKAWAMTHTQLQVQPDGQVQAHVEILPLVWAGE